MGIALNRHHDERWKKKVQSYYYGNWVRLSPRNTGIVARTRKLCSCYWCNGDEERLAFQERKARQDFQDQLDEVMARPDFYDQLDEENTEVPMWCSHTS